MLATLKSLKRLPEFTQTYSRPAGYSVDFSRALEDAFDLIPSQLTHART